MKETEFVTVIANKDQVLEAYPDLFDEIPFGITKVHIERLFNNQALSKEGRIVVLPGGIISVKTEDEELKDLHEKDEDFFTQLNQFTAKFNDSYLKDSDINLSKSLEIDEVEYGITFFPYKDLTSSSELMNRIESKMLVLQGNP
jgi:hypothetical protein